MSGVPRELREERLKRFLKRRENVEGSVARYEELLERVRDLEADETDFDVLKRHIAARLELEANLSETRAALLRAQKAIEKERGWLAKYDRVGRHVDVAAEQDGEAGVDSEELYSLQDVFEKVASDRIDDISLGELRLVMRRYAEMTRAPVADSGDEHVKQAIHKVMGELDETLDALRRTWQRIKDL